MPLSTVRKISKLNPATGQLIAEYHTATEADVRDTVVKSRMAQSQWGQASLKVRTAVLKTLRQALHQQAESVAEIISRETGKPLADSLEADIATALNILSYYIEVGENHLKPRWIQPDLLSLITGRLHQATWSPRGIIAIISPWNFPMGIACSGVAAALMAGNSVILKPSELTPATGEILIQLTQAALKEHGISEEVAQLLVGDGQTGADLIEQAIDGIIFTGSERTGKIIAQKAAERDLWFSLELGGSDAMLILEDADLEKAASYALWGRFVNTGQTCAAVKRLLVPAEKEAALLDLLISKITQLKSGPPDDPQSHIGPLISEAQRELIDRQVRETVQQGARLVLGGHKIPGPGFYYQPTLFTNVPPNAQILQEETFGPILPVIPYRNIEAAIHMINDSRYGLTASVFGSPKTARQIADKLDCGTVVINEVGPSNFALACAPWGGWKSSGSGSSHGASALRDLSRYKVISTNLLINAPLLNKPLWHFGENTNQDGSRSRTVMAFAARHRSLLNPKNWLPFWKNRASTKF